MNQSEAAQIRIDAFLATVRKNLENNPYILEDLLAAHEADKRLKAMEAERKARYEEEERRRKEEELAEHRQLLKGFVENVTIEGRSIHLHYDDGRIVEIQSDGDYYDVELPRVFEVTDGEL